MPASEPISEFKQTIMQRAARLGLSVDELRVHDREALRDTAEAAANCLMPHQLEDAELREIILHVLDCPICAAMVTVVDKTQKKTG
jgi:hypothetical protein